MAQMIFTKRSAETLLSGINPLSKLIALIALSFLLTSKSTAVFAATSLFILIIMISVRLPIFEYLMRSRGLLYLLLLIFITEALVSKSIKSTLCEMLKFFFLIALSSLLLDSTTPSEIASSIGGALSHIAGHSAWRFSSMVMLTLSFISRIFSTASTLLDARRARLGSFLYHPVKSISEYTVSLFLSLFEDFRAFSDALDARLFEDDAERLRPLYKASDYAIIALSLTLILCRNLI